MKEPKEVAFSFREVNLEEAERVVSAGEGKYSELIVLLSQKLPQLGTYNSQVNDPKKKKGFGFGLPGGHETDEKSRKNLCTTVNFYLKRGGIDWIVRYSKSKRLFLCVPKKGKKVVARKAYGSRADKGAREEKVKQVKRLREMGLSGQEVAEKLGMTIQSYYTFVSKHVKERS